MNDPILLLGPSGIGKTTVAKYAIKAVNHVRFVVLDNIAHQSAREQGLIDKREDLNALIRALEGDRNRLLEFGLAALDEVMATHAGRPVVVDVGTGFLDAEQSLSWVAGKPAIAITAEPAIAFDRFRKARKLDISYEQYATTQFSKPRRAIYQCAGIVIKSDSLDEQQLSRQFVFSLFGLLTREDARTALQEYLASAV